jgi:hypothetical protein
MPGVAAGKKRPPVLLWVLSCCRAVVVLVLS